MNRLFNMALVSLCVGLPLQGAQAALVAATLPTSRSVEVGQTATAFATVINAGAQTATGCVIEAAPGLDVAVSYQITDPATNAVVGVANSPVDIAPGDSQSFVVSVTPNSAFAPEHLELRYLCDGGEAAPSIEGLNTLLISGSAGPVADVIAITQTASMDGVLDVAADGAASAFAAATVNVGSAGSITVRPRATFSLSGTLGVCQTNPSTGECLAAVTESLTVAMGSQETATFSVFVASDQAIVADFASNRIALEFLDDAGVLRGSSGVAVQPGEPSVVSGAVGILSGGLGLLPANSGGNEGGVPVQIKVDVSGSGFRALGIGDPDSTIVLSGSGISAGAIDAFGSIITNGRRITTDSADFSIDGVSGSQDDLKVGQDVLVLLSSASDSAAAVIYRSKVKGPVTEVVTVDALNGRAEITVLGQRVRINGSTLFDGVSIETLAVGQLLEVSGVADDSGATVASYVELKNELPLYKVVGAIENLSGSQFTIDQLTVDFSSAVLDDFTSAGPVNGAIVEVKGNPQDFQAPAFLIANKVEPLPGISINSTASVQLEGFVDSFGSQNDFTVQRQPVIITQSTQIIDGDTASFALGVKVDVRGNIDQNGVLTATSIRIKPTEAVRAEGLVSSVNTSSSELTLLGVTFRVVSGTEFEDDSSSENASLALEDLQVGDYVEVRGFLDGTDVIALDIERDDSDSRARLRGPVSAFDSEAGTLEVLGVAISSQTGVTQFENLSDQIVSETEFFNLLKVGDFVKASWDNFVSTGEIADELSLED